MAFSFLLAPDVEELVVTYLAGAYSNVSTEMIPNAPMPFILVTCISGPDDMVTESAVVQIDVFHTTMTNASTTARQVHKSMKNLTAMVPVLMSSGAYASIDSLYVVETPHYQDFDSKEVRRYCGRYRIDLRCNLTT